MMSLRPITDWLPVTHDEMRKRGWDEPDVIIISGDAYVDHPAFGAAVIGRLIEKEGLRVAILPQPNWRDDLRDFRKLGKPRLFFGVTAGNMDSMVNHYTANKRLRSDDAYTAGNVAGFRPDYASVAYTQIVKKVFPDVPVILGGIEDSMRRLTHYDYWSDSLKPGILTWSGADMLVYGNGDKAIVEITRRLQAGETIEQLRNVEQTAFLAESFEDLPDKPGWKTRHLPSHEEVISDRQAFAQHFTIFEEESHRWQGARLIEPHGDRFTVINPADEPWKPGELDIAFDLPYTREPHPRYKKRGTVKAFEMIRDSINMHRGCFGGCSFCAIAAHQGKFIASRSEASILKELGTVAEAEDFKGHITDMGGPSANMFLMGGRNTEMCKKCRRPSCIFPTKCTNLNMDHRPMIDLYRKASAMKGIKKITIGSGIRYDMLVEKSPAESDAFALRDYLEEVVRKHVSGRLKVAPEHVSPHVLQIMRKPHYRTFRAFKESFDRINAQEGLRQQLIPYFISSHPGSQLADMAELAAETRDQGFRLEQVQDFTPTPMTYATAMFYLGFDPYSQKPVYVAKTREQKLEQQKFFMWYKPENQRWIREKLKALGRTDLLSKLSLRKQ